MDYEEKMSFVGVVYYLTDVHYSFVHKFDTYSEGVSIFFAK